MLAKAGDAAQSRRRGAATTMGTGRSGVGAKVPRARSAAGGVQATHGIEDMGRKGVAVAVPRAHSADQRATPRSARLLGVKAEGDLQELLAALSPRRRPGEYVFVVADEAKPVADGDVLASIVETEGLSLVLARHVADRSGFSYDFVAGWITLEVRSALDAVGLTAVVAAALTEAMISCNVLAGYHHDHLLVPYERVDDAINVLHELSAQHRSLPAARPTVRRACVADARAMTELARAAYTPYVTRIGREPAPMVADYVSAVRKDEAWVAEEDGRTVGLLVLRYYKDHVLLDNVAVSPDAQKLGVGSALLELAEDNARSAGVSEVRLYTNVAMTENLAYYPRHGYRETHRALQDGYQRVFFTKPVTST